MFKDFMLVKDKIFSKVKKIISIVGKIHSYENPCIIFSDVKVGNINFMNWVQNSLK